MSRPEKIIVGMSGGVDSSVAAWLLLQQGYVVEGLFMKNWDEDDDSEYCTAEQDLADAADVCDRLGIPLHTANFAAEYWDNVFQHFLNEYAAGRTPNPDILCNREIKFNVFREYAHLLGADRIATGHYVRSRNTGQVESTVDTFAQPGSTPDHFELLKGCDTGKDQSYFLAAVPVEHLRNCLFPLGELQKKDVRRIAAQQGFANHAKKDSTGICFIGERRFRDFLRTYLSSCEGPILAVSGQLIGQHQGLAYYTLGQREGLGIGGLAGFKEAPWYVAGKDLPKNALIVTQSLKDLDSDWATTPEINWLQPEPPLPLTCSVKTRYRQSDQECVVSPYEGGGFRVEFAEPQRAVTPGQYLCFYQGDLCLGGGVISDTGLRRLDTIGSATGTPGQ